MDAKLSDHKPVLPSLTLGRGAGALLAIALTSVFAIYILLPLVSLFLKVLLWVSVIAVLLALIWVLAPALVITAVTGVLGYIESDRR